MARVFLFLCLYFMFVRFMCATAFVCVLPTMHEVHTYKGLPRISVCRASARVYLRHRQNSMVFNCSMHTCVYVCVCGL